MDIEKAKKLLNRIDIKFFLNGTIEQNNYIVDKADEVNKAIETVLNELDKKDKRIKKIPDIEVIGDQKMWDINESNDPLTVTMFLKINELTDEINKLNERR